MNHEILRKLYENDELLLRLSNNNYLEIGINNLDLLRSYPEINVIKVSDLREKELNYLVDTYGNQIHYIYLFKCNKIADLSALGRLKNLCYVIAYWNIKAKQFWDMSNNENLLGIKVYGFTGLTNLDDIPTAPKLESLEAPFNKGLVSLKPLLQTKLKELLISFPSLGDKDITPLVKIHTLKKLNFGTILFTTEQVAWLKANLTNVEGEVLAPYLKIFETDVLVIGKRKPRLQIPKDNARIQKYVDAFEKLVEQYKGKEAPIY